MGKRLRKVYITIAISREETFSDMISDCDPRNAVLFVAIASPQIQTRWDLCYAHRMTNGLLTHLSLLRALKLHKSKVLLLVNIALTLHLLHFYRSIKGPSGFHVSMKSEMHLLGTTHKAALQSLSYGNRGIRGG